MKLIRVIGAAFAVTAVVALFDLDDKIEKKAKPYMALMMLKKRELDAKANMALAQVAKEAQAQAEARQAKADACTSEN